MKTRTLTLLLLALAPTLWTFGPLLSGHLLSDSLGYIHQAHQWRQLGFIDPFSDYLVEGFRAGLLAWRPLMLAAFQGMYEAFGANPTGWRAVHFGLHLINALLVGALIYRLCPRSPAPAMLALLLFASFAATAETVAWVADFGQVLALALALSAAHVQLFKRGATSIVILLLALAVAAKETGVIGIMLVSAIIWLQLESKPQRLRLWLRAMVPFGVLLALYLGWRWWLFAQPLQNFEPAAESAPSQLELMRFHALAMWRGWLPTTSGGLGGAVLQMLRALTMALPIWAVISLRGTSHFRLALALGTLLLGVTLISFPYLSVGPLGQGGRHLYFFSAVWAMTACLVATRAQLPTYLQILGLAAAFTVIAGQALQQRALASPLDQRLARNESPVGAIAAPGRRLSEPGQCSASS